MKSCGSIAELPFKLIGLRLEEESGISSVRVKSVDIAKNTDGEGSFLVQI